MVVVVSAMTKIRPVQRVILLTVEMGIVVNQVITAAAAVAVARPRHPLVVLRSESAIETRRRLKVTGAPTGRYAACRGR